MLNAVAVLNNILGYLEDEREYFRRNIGRNSSARRRRRLHRVAKSIGIPTSAFIESAEESEGDVAARGVRPMPSEAEEALILAARAQHLLKAVGAEWCGEQWDVQSNNAGLTGSIDLSSGHCSLCDDQLNEKLSDPDLWSGATEALRLHSVPSAGIEWVRNAVIKHWQRFHSNDSDLLLPDNVSIIPGAQAAFDLLGFCLFQPGDAILTVVPTYPRLAASFNCRADVSVIPVEFEDILNPCLNIERFQTELEAAERKGINVRAIAITNPLDPLGYVFPESELLNLCNWAIGRNLFIIVDEVLVHSASESNAQKTNQFQSVLSLRNQLAIKNRRNIIWVWSASKALGVPGARFGAVYTESPSILRALRSLTAVQPCPPIVQYLVGKLLLDADWLTKMNAQMLRQLNENRKFVFERLNNYGIKHFAKTNAGMTVALDLREYIDNDSIEAEEKLWHRFERVGVLMSPGNRFGSKTFIGWFRMNIAVPIAQLEEALQRIHTLLMVTDRRSLPSAFNSTTETIDLETVFRPMVGEMAKADRMSRDSLLDSSVSSNGGPADFELNQTVRSADSGHSGSTATLTEIAAIAADEEEEEGSKTPIAATQLQSTVLQHRLDEMPTETYESIFAPSSKPQPPPLPPRPQKSAYSSKFDERIFPPEPYSQPEAHSTPIAIRAEKPVFIEPSHISPIASSSDVSPGRPQSAHIPEEVYESIFERNAVSPPPPLPPRHREKASHLTTDYSAFLAKKAISEPRTPTPLIADDLYERIFERAETADEMEGRRSDTPIPEFDENADSTVESLHPNVEMMKSPLATPKVSTATAKTLEGAPTTSSAELPPTQSQPSQHDAQPQQRFPLRKHSAANVDIAAVIDSVKPRAGEPAFARDSPLRTHITVQQFAEPKNTIYVVRKVSRSEERRTATSSAPLLSDEIYEQIFDATAASPSSKVEEVIQKSEEPKPDDRTLRTDRPSARLSQKPDALWKSAEAEFVQIEEVQSPPVVELISEPLPNRPQKEVSFNVPIRRFDEPENLSREKEMDKALDVVINDELVVEHKVVELINQSNAAELATVETRVEAAELKASSEVASKVADDLYATIFPKAEPKPQEQESQQGREDEEQRPHSDSADLKVDLADNEPSRAERSVAFSLLEQPIQLTPATPLPDEIFEAVFTKPPESTEPPSSPILSHLTNADSQICTDFSVFSRQPDVPQLDRPAKATLSDEEYERVFSPPPLGDTPTPMSPDRPSSAQMSTEVFETIFKSTLRAPPALPPRPEKREEQSEITADFSAIRLEEQKQTRKVGEPTLTDADYELLFERLGKEETTAQQKNDEATIEEEAKISDAGTKFSNDSDIEPLAAITDAKPGESQKPENYEDVDIAVPTSGDIIMPDHIYESIFTSPATKSPPPLPPRPQKPEEPQITTDFRVFRNEVDEAPIGEPTLSTELYEQIFKVEQKSEKPAQRDVFEFGDSATSLHLGEGRHPDTVDCPSIQTRSSTDAAVALMEISESRLSFAEEREPLVNDVKSTVDDIDTKSDKWIEGIVAEAAISSYYAKPTESNEEAISTVETDATISEVTAPHETYSKQDVNADADWIAELIAETVATVAAQHPTEITNPPGVKENAAANDHDTSTERSEPAGKIDEPVLFSEPDVHIITEELSTPSAPLIEITDSELPVSTKICEEVASQVVENAIGNIRESDFTHSKQTSTTTVSSSLSAALDNAPARVRHPSRRELTTDRTPKPESVGESIAKQKSAVLPERVVTTAEVHYSPEMPSSPLRLPAASPSESHSPISPSTPPTSPHTPTTPTNNWISALVGKALGLRRLRQSAEGDQVSRLNERRLSAELILRADDLPYGEPDELKTPAPIAAEKKAADFVRSHSVDESAVRKTSIVQPISIETAAAIHSNPDAEVVVEGITPMADSTQLTGDKPPPVPPHRPHRADVIVGADPLPTDESDFEVDGFRSAKQSFVAVRALSALDRAADSVAGVVVSTEMELENIEPQPIINIRPKSLVSDEDDDDFRTPPESRSFHSSRDSRRITDRHSVRSDEYHDAPTFASDEDLLSRIFAPSQHPIPINQSDKRTDFRTHNDKDALITTDMRRFPRPDIAEKQTKMENLEATLSNELIDQILRMTVGATITAANPPEESIEEPEIIAEELEAEELDAMPIQLDGETESEADEFVQPVELHSDCEELSDGAIGVVELPLTDDEADRHSIASSAPEELIVVVGKPASSLIESRVIESQPPTQTVHFEYVRGTLHKAVDDADAIPWRRPTFRPKSVHEEQFALSADDILARVFRGDNLRFAEAEATDSGKCESSKERQLATGFGFMRRRASANRRHVEIPELLSDEAYERIFNPEAIAEEPEQSVEVNTTPKSPQSPLIEHVITHADHDPVNRVATPTPKLSVSSRDFRPRKSVRIADTVEKIADNETTPATEEDYLDLEKYGHLQPDHNDDQPQIFHPEDVFLAGGRRRKDSAELKREEMAKATALAEVKEMAAAPRSRKPTIEVIDEADLRRIATISDRHDLGNEVPHLVLKKQLSAAEAVLMKSDSQEATVESIDASEEPPESAEQELENDKTVNSAAVNTDTTSSPTPSTTEIPIATEIHRRIRHDTPFTVSDADTRPPPLFDDFSFIEEIVRESMLRPHRAHHQYRPEIEHFRMSIVEECSEGTGTPRESTGSPVSRHSARPMSGDIVHLFEGPLAEEAEIEGEAAESGTFPSISSAAASRLIDAEFAEIAAQSSASDVEEHSVQHQSPTPARSLENTKTEHIDHPFGPLHIDVPMGTASRPPRDPPNDSGVSVGTNSSGALTIDFPLLVQRHTDDTASTSLTTTSREDRSASPSTLPTTDMWTILGRAHTEAAHQKTQSAETPFSDDSEERIQHAPRPSMADSDDDQRPYFAVRLRTPPPKSPLAPYVAIASRRPPLIPVRDEHSDSRPRRFARHPASTSASPFDSSLESQKDFIALGGTPRRIQRRRRDEQERFESSADSELVAEMEGIESKSGDIQFAQRSKSATAINDEDRESRHRRVHHSLYMQRRPKSASPLGGGRVVVEHTNITEIVFENRGHSLSTEVLTTRTSTQIDSLSAESLLHELLLERARDAEHRRRRRDQIGVRERMRGNRRSNRRDPEFGRRRELHADPTDEPVQHDRSETIRVHANPTDDALADAESVAPVVTAADDKSVLKDFHDRSVQTLPLSLCCRMRIRHGDRVQTREHRQRYCASRSGSESSPSGGTTKQPLYTVRASTMPHSSRASSDSADDDVFTVTTTSDPHFSWIVSSVCRTTDASEKSDIQIGTDRPRTPNSRKVSPPTTTHL